MAQIVELYAIGRTILRYRRLAVGICVSLITSYGWDLANHSMNAVSAMPSAALPSSSVTNQIFQPTNSFSSNSLNNSLNNFIAQNESETSDAVKINSIRPVNNGLMLTVNANPRILMKRENNPDRLIVDLQNTEVIKELHKANLPINRFGVKQIRVAQFQNNPAIARLVFDLDSGNPNSKVDWQSQYIAATNTLLLTPSNQVAQAIPLDSSVPNLKPLNAPNPISTSAVIERLSFSNTGQLLIETSQPVNYRANFDRISGNFNLTVSNAKISANLQRPTLTANSPIERIRLSQVGNSVEIGIKTVKGWQVRETQRLNNQQIKLQISSTGVAKLPNNNSTQPALPNNSPSIFSPQNISDRRRGVIYIDAGHGGNDPGAVANGIQEKDVVLPISLNLGEVLQTLGYTVYYTRTNDVEIDLEPRVETAERINADVFVSIHANSLAANNSDISGIETYHSRNSTVGRELANYVHSQIISMTGASDRSVRGAGFYVIAKTSMPAILVETGFVTNPTEARNLSTPSYQKLMAEAIAKGIDQFMKVRGK